MDISSIKRFVFEEAGSNMFVYASESKALVIDPNVSPEALEYLYKNNVKNIIVLLTHEHYDHTSGLVWLCDKFSSTVICHEQTAEALANGRNNRPIIIASNLMERNFSPDEIKRVVSSLPQGYKYNADITFSKEYSFDFEETDVRMVFMPGHSRGSCCIEIGEGIVASGDLLIKDTPVITRFPGGSIELYNSITKPYLESFRKNTLVLPGHGEAFYI